MAIPKLKVYRLDNGYSQIDDNDMQYLSNDELLPISSKNMNPLTVQEMVGVRERRDAHMVVESNWKIVEFDMDITKMSTNAIETLTKNCDNWVMGKGNFRVFVKKVLLQSLDNSSSSDSSDTSSSSDSANLSLFQICCQNNNWYELDRKFWDYEIMTVKKYFYEDENGNLISTDQPSNDVQILQIHQVNEIYFKIGNMLTQSSAFFTNGYDNYLPIVGNDSENKIIIMYKTFRELNDEDTFYNNNENNNLISKGELKEIKNSTTIIDRSLNSDYSKFRVSFGNVYNGNKQGRCFFNNNGTTSKTYNNSLIDNTKVHYYEGNYMYKKKILPLRVLVAQEDEFESDFVADTKIEDNGSCVFQADYDWYVDGLMKPVLMQRIVVYDEEWGYYKIFKKLEENIQYTMNFQEGNNINSKISYKISFLDDYYQINRSYFVFPKEVFLFYNTVDDTLGNIFDFNYNYTNFTTPKPDINATSNDSFVDVSVIDPWQPNNNVNFYSYGYENRGNLILNIDYYKMFLQNSDDNDLFIYKKSEILAVMEGFNYDKLKDLLLVQQGNQLKFSMPISLKEDLYYNENFSMDLGYKIYFNGNLIYNSVNLSSSSAEEYFNSNDYQISFDFNDDNEPQWVISKKNDNVDFPKDLMLVFYEKHKMGFKSIQRKNPWCIGYRIPCYEKVKSSNLFVSSFPNWVKGHLNNDLDIFVGNKEYSGTTLDETNIQAIYPCYVNEGWYAMYPQGAVQFAQYQDEYDYFDIFNYGTQMGSVEVESNQWDNLVNNVLPNYLNNNIKAMYKIFYNKVKYNVAYYDGIYSVVRSKLSNYSIQNGGSHYALLQDDDFKDSVGKRWVLRDNNYIRFLYESGLNELPEKVKISNEETEVLQDVYANDGNFVRVDLKRNRISVINFQPLYTNQFDNSMIVCLNVSSDKTQIIDQNLLTNYDIRVHIKVDDYKLYIGLQHEKNCNIFEGMFEPMEEGANAVCNCNKQLPIESNYNINFFTLDNVKWYCLQPLQDYYDNLEINDVQLNVQDIGEAIINDEEKILKRYRYYNKDWNFNVYFEIFSYRYSQNKDANGKFPIQSVEYIVYKVDK